MEDREVVGLLEFLRCVESGAVWYHTAECQVRAACGAAAELLEAANLMAMLDRAAARERDEALLRRMEAGAQKEDRRNAEKPTGKRNECRMSYRRGFAAGVEAAKEELKHGT